LLRVAGFSFVWDLELSCVYYYSVIVVIWDTKKARVMEMPLSVLWILWHSYRDFVEGVDMCSHTMLVFLWHVNSSDHLAFFVRNGLFNNWVFFV